MCRTSSSPKETKSRAFGLGNRKSGKNSTGEFARARSGEGGREKARPVCSLSISSSSTSDPQLAALREASTRDLTRSRGGARCAPGKNGGFPFIILKPRAEGYETEIVANFALRGPINRFTCMRKTQAQNALTVWVFASDEMRARRYTAAKLHGTSPRGEQSSTEAVAEVQMDNRKGSSWVRNRNNEGQCDRFVASMTWRRHCVRDGVAPLANNWRDSIWVQTRSAVGVPEALSYAVLSYLWKRTTKLN